ncbi:sortilin-like [Anneissia japonica]|uniref:sortilin-like n=1 Tax=Anneissia japonica TaxID=1529436 RepID=UPI001425526A|nr:sortilin-like [Anneissia japonica]
MANEICRTWSFSTRRAPSSRPVEVIVYILTFLMTVAAFHHKDQQLNFIDCTSKSHQAIIFDQSRIGLGRSNKIVNNQEESFASRLSRGAPCEPLTEHEKTSLENTESTFEFKNDSNFNLALVWLGETGKELLALTTMDFGIFVGQSNLWISNDFGRTFINKNDLINKAIIRQDYGINKSPDPRKVIFVGYVEGDFTDSLLFITENSGETFVKSDLQFNIQGPLFFHRYNSDYILAHSASDQYSLWLSTDFGRTWTRIKNFVHSFRWGEKTQNDFNIYFAVDRNMMADENAFDLVLKRGRVSAEKKYLDDKDLQTNVFTFGVQDKFLFASVKSDEYSLWLSTDFGRTWTRIKNFVHSFRWGEKTQNDFNIYFAVDRNMMADENAFDLVLKRGRVSQEKKYLDDKDLQTNVFTFGVQDKFLFASVKSDESGSRKLMVSTDDGNSWNKAQLPDIKQDMFYSVLDSTEGMIFVHVDKAGNNGYGEIYTSDADGIVFSISLERHLYPNGGDVTDFYRVESIRGVYLASQILEDQTVRTKITFNRGAEWGNVKIQSGNHCEGNDENCYLQIHNKFSQTQGVNTPMGPLSNPNAVGLILVHGHPGLELHSTLPDVYITEDGGYSWRKVLDGPHFYAITNYGALLVAIPQSDASTNVIKYSVDAGQCWYNFVFHSEPIAVTGLLPEPNFKSLNVSIWGYNTDTRIWMAFSIDFGVILEKTCKYQVPTVVCGTSLIVLIFSSYERQAIYYVFFFMHFSDFGFRRKNEGNGPCELDPDFEGLEIDICINHEEEKEISKGYRLIPGDKCQGGFHPPRNLEDVHQHCDEINLSSRRPKHSGFKVFIALALLCTVFVCLVFIYRRHTFRLPCFKTRNITYRYSELSSKDELDNELDKALNIDEESHVYHDESDDDMLT